LAKSKKSIKKNSTSKAHVNKTRSEVEDYIAKVKSSSPAGSTDELTRLNSGGSYGDSTVTGPTETVPSERKRIPVPQPDKTSIGTILAWIVLVVSLVGTIIGFTRWITKLEGKIETNSSGISKIDTTVGNHSSSELDIKERLAKLEVWRDTFDKRLSKIEDDMQKGISLSEIDRRIKKLEGEVEVLTRNQNSKDDVK